jgi:D-alanine-D-alanine ligase
MTIRAADGPVIAVLCGSDSPEREVSLVSGREVAKALAKEGLMVELYELPGSELPAALDPARHVVFPALHGGWGENGGLQAALEARGFAYAGCGPESSRLCMDKVQTKNLLATAGLPVLPQVVFAGEKPPEAAKIISMLGETLIVKPVGEGSSVGLHRVRNAAELAATLRVLGTGRWMVEPWVQGREISVGVLQGRALGLVEIRPKGGVYDYQHKYTAGMTEYLFPAPVAEELTKLVAGAAEEAFAACRCRDFARVDFMLPAAGGAVILEINTLPGLTPTSLLPKSASCCGYAFGTLVRAMAGPALARFTAACAAA